MAAKRKVADAGEVQLTKKSRKVTDSNDSTDASEVDANPTDSASDASEGQKVQFTDKGKKRADSEAKRAWNYVCTFAGCGQRFNRPCRLEAHMRTHTKERPFTCDREGCDKTFPRKDHLQRHMTHHHAEPERKHTCDWEGCGKQFTSHGRLQRHKQVHESKFYCTGHGSCKEAFRKQETLDAHIKTVHLATKAHPCTFVDASGVQCDHGYQTEHSLRRHMSAVHSEKLEPRFFCMLCPAPGTEDEVTESVNGMVTPAVPMPFYTATDLKAHDTIVHPPTCSACGQVFKNKSNLDTHFKALHMSPGHQQLYTCEFEGCGKVFNKKSNLTTHVSAVHENRYRFACTADAVQSSRHPDLSGWHGNNACGKQLKSKAALDQHVRTHHLGLPNRKDTRKAAKVAKARKRMLTDPSPLSMLTGVGYEEGRHIPCLRSECPHRFARDRDLKRHMLGEAHRYTEADYDFAILERDADTGGQFWLGGLDDHDFASMTGSTDPSLPQTPMPYYGQQAMDVDTDMRGAFGKLKEIPLDPALMDANMFDTDDVEEDMRMSTAEFAATSRPQYNYDTALLAPLLQNDDEMQD